MNYNEKKNAGTWINLQDAYVLEKAKGHAGSWFQIGYSAPGVGASSSYESDNFNYDDNGTDGTTATGYWKATAKRALNDCPATTGYWLLTATADGTNVQYQPSGTSQCTNLTPAFDGLSRATAN